MKDLDSLVGCLFEERERLKAKVARLEKTGDTDGLEAEITRLSKIATTLNDPEKKAKYNRNIEIIGKKIERIKKSNAGKAAARAAFKSKLNNNLSQTRKGIKEVETELENSPNNKKLANRLNLLIAGEKRTLKTIEKIDSGEDLEKIKAEVASQAEAAKTLKVNDKYEDKYEDSMDKMTLNRLSNITSNSSKEAGKGATTKESNYQINDEGGKLALEHVKAQKEKVRKYLINFLNIVTGVGLNSTSLDNTGEPSKEVFEGAKNKLIKNANQLYKYEKEVPKKVEYSNIGNQIVSKVSRIMYDELDFNEKDTPRSSDILKKDFKANVYHSVDPDDKEAVEKMKSELKPMGKPMYNADIYEDLFLFISALRTAKRFNINDFDEVDKALKAMKNEVVTDVMSKRPENAKTRREKMEKALDSEDEKDYERARYSEIQLNKLNKAKDEIKKTSEEGKPAKFDLSKYQDSHKQGLRAAAGNIGDIVKYHGISTIAKIENVVSLINKWIKENNNNIIYVYGKPSSKFSGGNPRGFGALLFVPDMKPNHPQPLMYKDMPLFKITRTFVEDTLGGMSEEQKKHIKILDKDEKKKIDELLNNYSLDEYKYKKEKEGGLGNALSNLRKSSVDSCFNY